MQAHEVNKKNDIILTAAAHTKVRISSTAKNWCQ